MPVVHMSGSWFKRDSAASLMAELREKGHEIAVDWTSEAYQEMDHYPDQFTLTFNTGIEKCDVLLLSFEGMQERTHSATFYLYATAVVTGKRVVVYDPDAATRSERFRGEPVHPAFHDLLGWSFLRCPNVAWVRTRDELFTAIEVFCPWVTE